MCNKLFAVVAGLLLFDTNSAQSRECVDIALVLAVDGSGSISDQEYDFQKAAIATAFRDQEVISALDTAGVVALSSVFWGDGEFAAQRLDWFIVSGHGGAEPFIQQIEANRRVVFGNTDIGSGIWSALDMLSAPGLCAARKIVNVSGDGKETVAPKRKQVASLPLARERAREMGVTVNALVISDDVGDLASYYNRNVIVGPGSFVMEVRRLADYQLAIKKKLLRELGRQAIAGLEQPNLTGFEGLR